ncbi:hypothetical protein JOH52_006964 [Sinorhizobium meliloti]|nr:hypothetical protein [Sinorhizobium meliloti]
MVRESFVQTEADKPANSDVNLSLPAFGVRSNSPISTKFSIQVLLEWGGL